MKNRRSCYFALVYMRLKNTDLVANTVNMLWRLLWGAEPESEALQKVYTTTKKKSHEYLFSFESELSVNCSQLTRKSFAYAKIHKNQIIDMLPTWLRSYIWL